jgi:manganese transport protein
VRVGRFGGLALGVLTAVGGFVDMGGIVTASQAGARYRYALLWTVIPGLIGLIVCAEMAGRVAINSSRTLFDVIRDRLGSRLALLPLGSVVVVNTLTLVVEIAGMSLALQIATRVNYLIWFPAAALFLGVILWKAGFDLLENGSALCGLAMFVAVAAMLKLGPSWGRLGAETVHPSLHEVHGLPAYLFAAVGLLGSYMTPYQFAFYSSGAIEEEWGGEELLTNRITAVLGSIFGAGIDVGLMVVAAIVLFPRHADVGSLRDAGEPLKQAFGSWGLGLFLIGTFAVTLGAGLETALSGSYAVCQYFGWDWGKKGRPGQAPLFSLGYIVMILLAVAIAYTHVDPIQLTMVTMAAAAVALPFTFLPLLIVANDQEYVGEQHNSVALNLVAILIFALLCLVTLAALPLFVLSGGGG